MIRFLLILSMFLTITANGQDASLSQLKPGLYKGSIHASERPEIKSGYYWLKPDSNFVLAGIGNDSTVLHLAKGTWNVNKDGALTINYEECPIHNTPRNRVTYSASNKLSSDSTQINVYVLGDNGDTIRFYWVFVDDTMHTVFRGAKGNPVGNNTNGPINLSPKGTYNQIRISCYDKAIPYFDEAEVPLIPGFNVHDITLHVAPTADDWMYFRPMKKGEGKSNSFTSPFTIKGNSSPNDYSRVNMRYLGDNVTFIRSALMRAVRLQPGYKDYFLWALASL